MMLIFTVFFGRLAKILPTATYAVFVLALCSLGTLFFCGGLTVLNDSMIVNCIS